MKKDKIGLLYRVSSEIQETEGNSLDVQQKMGREISKKLNLDYVEFNEGVQSSFVLDIKERPILIELLDEISKPNGIRKVWVFNTDRLGRTSNSWVVVLKVFLDYGVEVYIGENSTKPYNLNDSVDKLTIGVLTLISQYDNELRRMRSVLGKKNSLKNGNTFIGGTVPFGYIVKNKKLYPHPIESSVVLEVFKMYDQGKSNVEIKSFLDRLPNVEPRRSRFGWNLGTIQSMLRKEIYKGQQEWIWKEKLPNGEVKIIDRIVVNVPPLVDDELWDNVNQKISLYLESRMRNRDGNRESVLKGLLKCSECNKVLGHRFKSTNHYYGRCREYNFNSLHKIDVNKCPMSKSLLMEETNEKVLDTLISLIKDSSIMREEFKKKYLGVKWEESSELKRKQNSIKKSISDYNSLVEKTEEELVQVEFEERIGDLNHSTGIKLKEKFKERIEELNSLKKEKIDELKLLETTENWIGWLDKMSNEIDEIKEYNTVQKKEFLHQLIDSIKVRYIESEQSHQLDFKFRIPIVGDSIQYSGIRDKRGYKSYDVIDGNQNLRIDIPINRKHKNKRKPKERKQIMKTIISCLEENGMSLQQTCDFLNKNGLTPINGGKWYKSKLSSFYKTNRELSPK
jgi:DNA invertase Pin-like site-specific DNA recombinase